MSAPLNRAKWFASFTKSKPTPKRPLYARTPKPRSFQARRAARSESAKIVDDFFKLCKSLHDTDIPGSPVYEAVNYALNIETELKRFLDDPKLNIDNNPVERIMKGIAVSRKNFLFTSSEAGGQNLAILFSFS